MNQKYKEYLQSSRWKEKTQRIKSERNYTCELCGNHILLEVVTILANANHPSWQIPEIERFARSIYERIGDRDKLIEIHHKTYKHIYDERDNELACLCRPCHVFCGENAVGASEAEGWQKTQVQVDGLLKKIKNKPDGNSEFDHMSPGIAEQVLMEHGYYDEFRNNFRTELDDEYDERANDYYTFVNDYFDTQDEYD